jgi:hypothetical protein
LIPPAKHDLKSLPALRAELQGGHPAAPERYFELALIGGASAERPHA